MQKRIPLSPSPSMNPADETTNDQLNISSNPINLSIEVPSNNLGLANELSGSRQPPPIGAISASPTLKNIILEWQQQVEKEELDQGEDPPNATDDYVSLKLSIVELSKKISKVGTAHLKGKALNDAARFKKEVT